MHRGAGKRADVSGLIELSLASVFLVAGVFGAPLSALITRDYFVTIAPLFVLMVIGCVLYTFDRQVLKVHSKISHLLGRPPDIKAGLIMGGGLFYSLIISAITTFVSLVVLTVLGASLSVLGTTLNM